MMNGRTIVVFTLLMLCLGALPHAEAFDVIDISDGNLTVGSWGPGQGSYGQTFTAPAGDCVLLDYSFSLESMNAQFPFVSQVYAWTGFNVTGPSLYTSAVLLSPPINNFATYVFSPSIPVIAGQQYIAFVTNQPDGVPLGGPPESGGNMLANQDNPYAGGQFVFTGSNPAIGPWALTLNTVDAVFHATFASESDQVHPCRPSRTASSRPTVFYSDRASFLAAVGESITDGYTGYPTGTLSDVEMSAVIGETEYESLSCADCNLVGNVFIYGDGSDYCAGCNGNFRLSFTKTSLTSGGGVFGVGVDIVFHTSRHSSAGDVIPGEISLDGTVLIEYKNGEVRAITIPADVGFFGPGPYFLGVTDPRGIKSLTFGIEPLPLRQFWVIDNLTIAGHPSGPGNR